MFFGGTVVLLQFFMVRKICLPLDLAMVHSTSASDAIAGWRICWWVKWLKPRCGGNFEDAKKGKSCKWGLQIWRGGVAKDGGMLWSEQASCCPSSH